MKTLITILLLAQLAFNVYALGRMSGIEDYLANDWKGSDISDRTRALEWRLEAIEEQTDTLTTNYLCTER